jgi:hypothetical protein
MNPIGLFNPTNPAECSSEANCLAATQCRLLQMQSAARGRLLRTFWPIATRLFASACSLICRFSATKRRKPILGRSLVQGEQINVQREQIEQTAFRLMCATLCKLCEPPKRGSERRRLPAQTRQQQYESEQRKLDAGQSNIYQVLERQTALMTARSAELRAQTD